MPGLALGCQAWMRPSRPLRAASGLLAQSAQLPMSAEVSARPGEVGHEMSSCIVRRGHAGAVIMHLADCALLSKGHCFHSTVFISFC